MKLKTHFFLTIFMASALTGYALYEFHSLDTRSDLRPVQDIGIDDGLVTLKTQCFNLELKDYDSDASDLDEVLDGSESFQHNFALQILSSDVSKVEINDIENNRFESHLVLESGDRISMRPIDGIILGYQADVPVFIDEDLIIEYAEPTCLERSINI